MLATVCCSLTFHGPEAFLRFKLNNSFHKLEQIKYCVPINRRLQNENDYGIFGTISNEGELNFSRVGFWGGMISRQRVLSLVFDPFLHNVSLAK